MTKHLPLVPEKNLYISIKLDGDKTTQIPVAQLPEHIRVEVAISDEIKVRMSEAYHEYNRLELSYQGHQALLQKLLYEQYVTKTTSEGSQVERTDK